MPNGELISVTINDGIKKFSELGRHDNSNEDKSKYKKVCIGDIAYNSMRMWQGASGYSPYNGIVSPAYTVLVANEDVNSKCIAYQFKLPRMIHAFQINSQGITSDNWNLKFPTLSDISIYISRCIDEQGKIASLLESLDHLITLHQSKSFGHILKVIVSCTLSWEQRKLGDIVREVTRVDENSNAPVMMITANDGFIEQSERYSTDNAGKSLKKYILLKKWELAYNHGASKIRPFGSCVALTRATNIRIPFVYHCFLSLEDNPEFLEQTLNGKNVENQLRKIVSSGARMDGLLNISFQEYTSIFIRCPIRKEQDKIAILIKSLDHLITLHQLEPFQLIFKAIAYRIIDYAKSKPPRCIK